MQNDVLDFPERNQVAQRLLPGKKPHGFTAVLSLVRAKKFAGFKSSAEKMKIVDQGVTYLRCGKHRWQLRLPDALGHPRAGRPLAKMLFDVRREALDLFVLVLGRNHRQNRLVESAADHFHLLAFHQRAQLFEIFRMIFLNPNQQWSRIMQSRADFGVFFEMLDEWKIGALVAAFQYVFEISDGLMGVNQQGQMEFWRHGDVSGLHP